MCTAVQILDMAQKYSGVLQASLLAFALVFTFFQLRRAQKDRHHANVAAINERVMSHNALILADPDKCALVAAVEGLKVPEGQASAYWAARAVHLGHVNLLSQVWELSGRPKPGRHLLKEFGGWETFARDIVARSMAEASAKVAGQATAATAAELAASDLWTGISTYEVTGQAFNSWLCSLSDSPTRQP